MNCSICRINVMLCALVLVCLPPADAQVLYGSIVGTVVDTSGSVVPLANAKITNSSTGQSREVMTTQAGTYALTDVLPGSYSVTISAQGFRTAQVTNVSVTINTVVRVDVQLQVGAITDTITVTSDASKIQADNADLHVALGVAELTQLPLP